MASRFNVPITQLVNDDASGIGSGWLMNFYITGTTTRKDTFSDNPLTSTNANPVVADSSGRFADIFLESGTYKVVLTDAAAVEKWTADPVAGSVGTSGVVDEKTASYTVTIDDATKIIAVNATSGNLTITLLAAAAAGDGFEVTVKKTDSSTNSVTVDGNGAETIDGAANYVLKDQYETVSVRSDASNWLILSTRREPLSNDPSPQLGGDISGNSAQFQWSKGADVASAADLPVITDGNYFDVTGTTTVTTIATTGGIGTTIKLHFDGALILTHDATNLILPGGANITTAAGDEVEFTEYASADWRCTNYIKATGRAVITIKTEQDTATTSGTAIGFTGIPSGTQRITMMLGGVGLSGTDNLIVQIGDSGGYETSGYLSASNTNVDTVANSSVASTSGFIIQTDSANISAVVTLVRKDAPNFTWQAIHQGRISGTVTLDGMGFKDLSAELDRIQITRTGSDTFDAGDINILHE